jgi:hypothetical protein
MMPEKQESNQYDKALQKIAVSGALTSGLFGLAEEGEPPTSLRLQQGLSFQINKRILYLQAPSFR